MNPPEISPFSFYGKKSVSLSSNNDQPSAYHSNPSIMPFKPQSVLLGPTRYRKVFHKQNDALEEARQRGGGLMCFAFQPSATEGTARLFLVAHPEAFWHYDEQRSTEDRCSFEVIPENHACKLYLDLEYDVDLNPDRDGSAMTTVLKRILISYLALVFGVHCDDDHIVELDSSTEQKFSRHLIFNLTSACFLNNYHAGRFVKQIFEDIRARITDGAHVNALSAFSMQDLSSLYVQAKQNQTFFCDLSVYTKNRHFRLYQSTKRGKRAPLVLKSTPSTSISELDVFLSSLVTYVRDDLKLLDLPSPEDSFKSSTLPSKVAATISLSSNPFPVVDDFIRSLVQPCGRIYRSGYFSSSNTLIYDIVGYRYCGNIGRHHKSNNIKYVVDLNGGVYYQKCYDPDCARYKSPEKCLPVEIAFQVSSNDVYDFPDEALDIATLVEEAYEANKDMWE